MIKFSLFGNANRIGRPDKVMFYMDTANIESSEVWLGCSKGDRNLSHAVSDDAVYNSKKIKLDRHGEMYRMNVLFCDGRVNKIDLEEYESVDLNSNLLPL